MSLTKKGSNYWGCCPFHHEKTPSFKVSADNQLYYCFGCKESGNAITFLKKMESIDSYEAVKILADAAGMQMTTYKFDKKTEDIKKKKERLLALMKDAALHYHENIYKPEAKPALDYAEGRQITSMIKKFGLGYSLGRFEMIDYLKSKGYSYAEMKDAGIAEQRADTYCDVFMNRLMIPIINPYGSVIAFGGRILEKNSELAKYRNSKQTILFDKSKVLFNLNLVKKLKQQKGLSSIIITEGYMDTISLYKAGIENVVASMGTSLTIEQAKLIKNYCDKVYISYDGDFAGQKATLRGLDILESVGLTVKVVPLSGEMDPDDIIKTSGAQGYRELLGNAISLTAFKLNSLARSYDLSDPDGKSKYAVEAIKTIKKLSPVEQEEYLGQIHKLTGYSMTVLMKQAELEEPLEKSEASAPREEIKNGDVALSAQEFVLASLINEMPYADFSHDILPYLTNDKAIDAYKLALEKYKERYTLQSLYNRIDEEDRDYIVNLINYNFMSGDDKKKFDECVILLKRRCFEAEKTKLIEKYNSTKDGELLSRLNEIEIQLKQMKKSGGF